MPPIDRRGLTVERVLHVETVGVQLDGEAAVTKGLSVGLLQEFGEGVAQAASQDVHLTLSLDLPLDYRSGYNLYNRLQLFNRAPFAQGIRRLAMFDNRTKVLLILPEDVVHRARVVAARATISLKLPVSLQIVLRALIEEGLKRDGQPALRANVERQARAVRHRRGAPHRAGAGVRRSNQRSGRQRGIR